MIGVPSSLSSIQPHPQISNPCTALIFISLHTQKKEILHSNVLAPYPQVFNPRPALILTALGLSLDPAFGPVPRAALAEKTLMTPMTNLLRFRPHLCTICSIHVVG